MKLLIFLLILSLNIFCAKEDVTCVEKNDVNSSTVSSVKKLNRAVANINVDSIEELNSLVSDWIVKAKVFQRTLANIIKKNAKDLGSVLDLVNEDDTYVELKASDKETFDQLLFEINFIKDLYKRYQKKNPSDLVKSKIVALDLYKRSLTDDLSSILSACDKRIAITKDPKLEMAHLVIYKGYKEDKVKEAIEYYRENYLDSRKYKTDYLFDVGYILANGKNFHETKVKVPDAEKAEGYKYLFHSAVTGHDWSKYFSGTRFIVQKGVRAGDVFTAEDALYFTVNSLKHLPKEKIKVFKDEKIFSKIYPGLDYSFYKKNSFFLKEMSDFGSCEDYR